MTNRNLVFAWCVHALTASGALVAGLSLLAIWQDKAAEALLWLLLAAVIDGIDGPLARKFEVSTLIPSIDGALLDLIVDYLTYVFVPVVFLFHFDMLPSDWSLVACAAVLISSLYLFCNRNMKAQDHYFVGFPSVWNGVVIYAFVFSWSPWTNFAILMVLSLLTFVPIKVVHPFRVRALRALTASLAVVWMFLTAWVLVHYPTLSPPLLVFWVALAVYFIGISAWRTLIGTKDQSVKT